MFLQAYSNSFLEVAYRPDLSQLTGRWLQSVSEPELLCGYDMLRRAALQHNCGSWLIDSRRRTTRTLSSSEWVTTYFLPQMQRELGGQLCVGFLVLPDYLCTVKYEVTPVPAAPLPSHKLHIASFLDEGSAASWLTARHTAAKAAVNELVPKNQPIG